MVNLPDDIILDICVRLPAKTIGRFRCVNKNWYKLLNDRQFVQKHLCHATEINRLRIMVNFWKNHQDHIYTIYYDPSSSKCNGHVNTHLPFIVDKHFPLDNLQSYGYCNGLVCLSPFNRDILCLWNPSTNEFKHLPKPPLDTQKYITAAISYGLGYDYEIGEFKVLCFTRYLDDSESELLRFDVYLYTSGSDTWKTLDATPYYVYCKPDEAQVRGVLHLEAYRELEGSKKTKKVILSFNFEKEIFQEMPWPDLSSEEVSTDLCVLGGSLCIWVFIPDIGVQVWELKECEERKSWNKLFTIDVKKHFGSVNDFGPLKSLKNGEFLFGFDTDGCFHVHQYDPKHETTRLLFVYEDSEVFSFCFNTTVYVEGLVSPSSGSYVDDNDNDNDNDDDFEVVDDDTMNKKKKSNRV